jgi:hypothetical protein
MKLITTALLASALVFGFTSASSGKFETIELDEGFEFTQAQATMKSQNSERSLKDFFIEYNAIPEVIPPSFQGIDIVKELRSSIQSALGTTEAQTKNQLMDQLSIIELFDFELNRQLESMYDNPLIRSFIKRIRKSYYRHIKRQQNGMTPTPPSDNNHLANLSDLLRKNPRHVTVADLVRITLSVQFIAIQRHIYERNYEAALIGTTRLIELEHRVPNRNETVLLVAMALSAAGDHEEAKTLLTEYVGVSIEEGAAGNFTLPANNSAIPPLHFINQV